jgi:hypothetical protein
MNNDQTVVTHLSYSDIQNTIYVPSIQRNIDENVVLEMRQHIKDTLAIGRTPIFGCLDIVNFNGVLYVTDGNHRLSALRDEYNENGIPVQFNVIYYNVDTWDDLTCIFEIRNKNVPLPDYIKFRNEPNVELLKEIQNHLTLNYNVIFNNKSNRPYINLTSFMNSLSTSILFKSIIDNDTLNKFKLAFIKANNDVKNNSINISWCKKNAVTNPMVLTCTGCSIYLGLDRNLTWLNYPYIPTISKFYIKK